MTAAVTVNPGALSAFEVTNTSGGIIPTETAGTPFSIKVRAVDAFSNTVTSFSGGSNKVMISSTGTLSAGSGATAGFTNGVLASHSVTISNTGTFTITATKNPSGPESGTSNSFLVNAPACTAPSITTQPIGTTLTVGDPLSLSVVASGSAPLTYQWKKGATNVGTNSASFSVASVTTADAGTYTVTVSNSCGNTTSNTAIVNVNKATPVITWNN